MVDVLTEFRDKMKKYKDKRMSLEGRQDVGFSTGLTNIDFRNGTTYVGMKDGKPYVNYILGLIDGSLNMIIGKSGTGKTTMALQMAGYIARNYDGCEVYHDDIEGGSTYARRKAALKFTDDEMESRYIYRNTGITTENVYERIKEICDIKREHYDELLIPSGVYDSKGEEVQVLRPTIYIIDSLPGLMPDKYTTEDEMSGQMAATATAKANKALGNRLLQIIKSANVICIFINHINDDVNLGLVQKKPMLNYLKQGETLPGGKGIHYLMNNVIRIDESTKLKEDEKFYIDGFKANVSFVKSRTNKAGKSIPMIYDQDKGYDNELSILELLNTYNKVNGAGRYLYIGDYKDKKFSNRTFKEQLAEDEEFATIVMTEAIQILKSLMSKQLELDDDSMKKLNSNSVANKITDMLR